MLNTRFTEKTGVKHPIQCGTMMNISNAEFVAACANAGILACLASAMFPDKKSLVEEISKLRTLTDQPFGVNVSLFPGHDPRSVDVTLDILSKADIKVIETAGRSPKEHLKKIRDTGAVHIHKCARLRDAVKVEELGIDMVTLVGAECGGHPGMENVGTLVLIPEATNRIRIPLIAGGGFCDGKGLLSALALGADGVLMGSRFLLTEECKIHPDLKKRMLTAEMTDTMIIQKSIQSPARVLKNQWAEKINEMESQGISLEELLSYISGNRTATAYTDGSDDAIFPCGQVIGRANNIITVKDLVESILAEAKDVKDRINGLYE